jgi:hypothetical protein
MKTIELNDIQLESLKTMISYILDNEEEHYYCWIYNDNNLPEKHIYAHALKLEEVLNNV